MKLRVDKTMNEKVTVPETLRETVYWTGTEIVYDVNTMGSYVSHMRRVRTPSGGAKLPLREKSFENGSLKVIFPYGTLRRPYGGKTYVTKGPHSGVINMFSGSALRCNMAYPMNATFPSVSQALDQYPPPLNQDLLSQAEVKCLNKLKGKSTEDELSFGLVWGERHETVKLFSQAVGGTVKTALALKRGDYAGAVKVFRDDFKLVFNPNASMRRKEQALKKSVAGGVRSSKRLLAAMSDMALLWNLGISPLLKDLEAAQMLLQTGLLTKDWDIKSVSRHSRTVQDDEEDSWGTTRVRQTFSENHGYTVTLIGAPVFSTRALLGRLGLTNLPNLAYQLTPLSFILDYFYAVGPWLEAMEVPSLFEFKDGSYSQKVDRVIDLRIYSAGERTMKGSAVLNFEKRTVYGSFPYPFPPLSPKGKSLSEKQTLNTALVGVSRLKSLLS